MSCLLMQRFNATNRFRFNAFAKASGGGPIGTARDPRSRRCKRCQCRCPVWVISGHCPASASCLLYPRKRTFVRAFSMSASISGHGKITWDLDQSPHERYQRQTAPHGLLLIGVLTVRSIRHGLPGRQPGCGSSHRASSSPCRCATPRCEQRCRASCR
jgi:hypothetical protein